MQRIANAKNNRQAKTTTVKKMRQSRTRLLTMVMRKLMHFYRVVKIQASGRFG